MAIPSRQIGWSTENNLLWQISKQLEQLTGVTKGLSIQPSVEFYTTSSGFPPIGSSSVIYVAEDTELIYRWDGVAYVELSASSATPSLGLYTFGGVSLNTTADTQALPYYFQQDNQMYGPYTVYGALAMNFQPFVTSLSFNGEGLTTVNISNTTHPILTTASYPNLVYITTGFAFNNSTTITSVSAPLLKAMETGLQLTNCPALTSINLNSLARCSAVSFSSNGTSSLSLPSLKTVFSGGIIIGAAVTSVSFPVLQNIISTGGNAITITGPVTALVLPSIRTIGGPVIATSISALTTVTLGSGLLAVNGNVNFAGCALNQASVDNILVRLAALDGTNGTVAYSNRTVSLNAGTNATPSATGLAAKAVLVARGCTVTNN